MEERTWNSGMDNCFWIYNLEIVLVANKNNENYSVADNDQYAWAC